MEIPPQVQAEWHEQHALTYETLTLLHACADPGDPHPILTAVELLRAAEAGYAPHLVAK
jgi:hypothetical protein